MRFKSLVPLLLFVLVAGALFTGLFLKPAEVPSVLVGKLAPEFVLPPLEANGTGFGSADLRAGHVSVVNVFASWCVPCRVEHPQLMEIAKTGVPLYAIAYKDRADAVRKFLAPLGNPYAAIGDDRSGRVGIDWGVYGVPETFVISGDGHIIYRHVGPIMKDDVTEKILPAIEQAKGVKGRA